METNTRCVGVNFRHWTELRDMDPEQQWIVDDLLLKGGSSILVAQPKVGKTTMLYYLADCVAKGKPFLGRPTRSGPVAMLMLEGHSAMHKQRLRDFGILPDDRIFVHSGSMGSDGIDGFFKAIANMEEPPVLVIVDTLFRLVRVEDGNSYAAMVSAIEPLTAAAETLNCHIIFAHHATKAVYEGSAGLQALGSTAISGGFDTILTLQKRAEYRMIDSEVRWGTAIPKSEIHFNEDSCEYKMTTSIADDLMAETCSEIFCTLIDGEKSRDELRAIVKSTRFSQALNSQLENGNIVREKSTRKGKPYVYRVSRSTPD